MLFRQTGKLSPKKRTDGAALKTFVFKHQLSKFRGFRKLANISKALGLFVLLYLTGYQPTLAIPPVKQATVAEANFTQEQQISAASFSEPINLPHPGYLTTSYSYWHPGVDIATGLGMPIHPILSGKVAEVIYSFWGFGHYVVIEHEQGLKSTYAHMGRIFVKTGDLVTETSTLGEVGMTGHTSGPHTHLEITKDNKNIDPVLILPQIPDFATYTKAVAQN